MTTLYNIQLRRNKINLSKKMVNWKRKNRSEMVRLETVGLGMVVLVKAVF